MLKVKGMVTIATKAGIASCQWLTGRPDRGDFRATPVEAWKFTGNIVPGRAARFLRRATGNSYASAQGWLEKDAADLEEVI